MKKGQISIDILLALFVAIIFFGIYMTYADAFSGNVKQVEEQAKMKTVLMDVYSSIGAVKAHGGSGFSMAYNAPAYAKCTIEITANANGSITVTSTKYPAIKAEYKGIDLSEITLSNITLANTFDCGDVGITISTP